MGRRRAIVGIRKFVVILAAEAIVAAGAGRGKVSRTRLLVLGLLTLSSSVGVFPASAAATDPELTTCPDGGATGFSFPAGTNLKGDLVVPPGVYCSLLDMTVKGDVHAQPGAAYLAVDLGTVIKGDVTGFDMPSVVLQTARIEGSIHLQNITSVVNMVGPVVKGGVDVATSNGVVLFSSVVNADVSLSGNQFVLVGDNFIRGTLSCDGNASVSVPQPNTVLGSSLGQCAAG
jgi:hypothetical protein